MRRLLALSALACLLAPTPLRAAAGFYLPSDLPAKPAGLAQAYAAVIRLERANFGGVCSAVAVSPDGYVLTNIHCVESCLEDSGFFERGDGAVSSGDGYRAVSIARQPPPEGIACPQLMWSTESLYQSGGRVVWLGRGKETFSEEKVGGMSASAAAALAEDEDDAALMKFDVPSPVPCLSVAERAPAASDPLWAIGYPLWTSRHDGRDSDGASKYVSYGLARASIREDPYLAGRIGDEAAWSRLETIYGRPQLLLSDLDLMPGNSGGATIDADGKLVGLTYGNVKGLQERYTGSTGLAVRSATIVSEVRAALGADAARTIFSCPRR